MEDDLKDIVFRLKKIDAKIPKDDQAKDSAGASNGGDEFIDIQNQFVRKLTQIMADIQEAAHKTTSASGVKRSADQIRMHHQIRIGIADLAQTLSKMKDLQRMEMLRKKNALIKKH